VSSLHRAGVAADTSSTCTGTGSGRATALLPERDECRRAEVGGVIGPLGLGAIVGNHVTGNVGILAHVVQNRQVTWQSPLTNRLLLEAGLGGRTSRPGARSRLRAIHAISSA
jgi:hypothetical protein